MKQSRSDCDVDTLHIIFDHIQDADDQDAFTPDFINWQPLYDLYITQDEMVVTIEIAGLKPKDFSIYAATNYLIIDGIKKSHELLTKECCKFHNIEIPYGRFNRRIDFPVPVEAKQYQYNIDNGMLTLRFPLEKERIIPIEDG